MIRLMRPPEPAWWPEFRARNEREWNTYFEEPMDQRPDFDRFFRRCRGAVREVFWDAQSGKCAYCESPCQAQELDTDAFRPRHNASVRKGTYLPKHYFWLAFDWTNFIGSCRTCNANKANRWPIAGAPAAVGATGSDLEAEQPLLLNPFDQHPERHLTVDALGQLFPLSKHGAATIETLRLNREGLVARRRQRRQELLALVGEWESAPERTLRVLDEVGWRDHAMVARSVFLDGWGHQSVSVPSFWRSSRLFATFDWDTLPRSPSTRGPAAPPLPAVVAPPEIRAPLHVAMIEVGTFKSLSDITIAIDAPESISARRQRFNDLVGKQGDGGETPAMVLLGENACGKTSLLQACALALSQRPLRYRSDDFLPPGVDEGRVRVTWSDGTVRSMHLRRGRRPRRSGPLPGDLTVFAFGAASPTVRERRRRPTPGDSHIHNLFERSDQSERIQAWLDGLSEERDERGNKRASDVRQAIGKLTGAEASLSFKHERAKTPFRFVKDGKDLDLRQLSAGYQWLIGVACEIMAAFFEREVDMVNGDAIVLIDEFGAPLHPRWKMVAMRRLRACFPRVQFIVATHDPLCLRGVRRGEVTLMQRDDDGAIDATQDLPSPEGLPADQLLCSEFFGLSSTMDEDVERTLRRFQELAARDERTEQERAEYRDLKERLKGLRLLGTSEREAMMLEVVDAYIGRRSKRQERPMTPLEELREDMWRRIWHVVDGDVRPEGE
jgi:5-methylcytosine-specific restriction endonuclease McrA